MTPVSLAKRADVLEDTVWYLFGFVTAVANEGRRPRIPKDWRPTQEQVIALYDALQIRIPQHMLDAVSV